MLDGVKGGDVVELSLLLALRGGGSSFSHIVLISGVWTRCGRVKAAGVPALSSHRLRPPGRPAQIQGCVRVASLARASSSPASQLSPLLPSVSRPPFSPAGRLLCLGSSGLPATSVSAPLPCPEPLLETAALYVFYGCC